jgi:GNAT superfamily N-acetyltransferase
MQGLEAMTETTPEAVANVFIDAIAMLELDPARTTISCHEGICYFVHHDGREGTAFTHEFFPIDRPADEAIGLAGAIAGKRAHLITPLGPRIQRETAIYEARGYRRTGEWTVMARALTEPLAVPGDERAQTIFDAMTEARVLRAVLPDGGTGHPTRGGHVGNPSIRQRWVEDGGEPVAFGRVVVPGEIAYLGDMATAPAYRRRGHAAAIARRLLDDAMAVGATTTILVSTAMARDLYAKLGFTAVMPMVEFRSI